MDADAISTLFSYCIFISLFGKGVFFFFLPHFMR